MLCEARMQAANAPCVLTRSGGATQRPWAREIPSVSALSLPRALAMRSPLRWRGDGVAGGGAQHALERSAHLNLH